MDQRGMESSEDRWRKIESTMQFILEQQAQAEARHAEHEARHAEHEALHAAFEADYERRWERAEKQTAQLKRVLVAAIVAARRERSKIDEKFKMLIDSQMRTDAKLQAFIDSLRQKNGN